MIHALENAFVVKDGQGKIMQYRGVFLDITEVKNFQAQLQRERDFTSKILNNTQTMIMVADTAGLISYANQRVYEGGGFRAERTGRPPPGSASFRFLTSKLSRSLRGQLARSASRTTWN